MSRCGWRTPCLPQFSSFPDCEACYNLELELCVSGTHITKKGQEGGPRNYWPALPYLNLWKGGAPHSGGDMEDKKVTRNGQHRYTKVNEVWLTNLAAFCDGRASWMDEGRTVDIFYLAFSKAFHTVSHNMLTGKLWKCRLDEWVVGWIKNWLSSRSQRIMISDMVWLEACHQWCPPGFSTGLSTV